MRQHFAQYPDVSRATGSLYERISVQDFVAAKGSVTFEWLREYEEVVIFGSKISVATDNVELRGRTKRRGQSAYDSAVNDYLNNGHWFSNDGAAIVQEAATTNGHDHLLIMRGIAAAGLGTGTREEANIEIRLLNGLDGRRPEAYTEAVIKSSAPHITVQAQFSHGFANGGEHIGIDIYPSTGDISSGRFYAIGRVPLRT